MQAMGEDTSIVQKLATPVNVIWEYPGKNDKKIIETLALSFPDRLQKVKNREGRLTKY